MSKKGFGHFWKIAKWAVNPVGSAAQEVVKAQHKGDAQHDAQLDGGNKTVLVDDNFEDGTLIDDGYVFVVHPEHAEGFRSMLQKPEFWDKVANEVNKG